MSHHSAKEIVINNLVWIITSLLAIGVLTATIKYQGELIENNSDCIEKDKERIICIEKSLVRIESMEKNIAEIKYDIKDIKSIILRPVMSSTSFDEFDKIDEFDEFDEHTPLVFIPSIPIISIKN